MIRLILGMSLTIAVLYGFSLAWQAYRFYSRKKKLAAAQYKEAETLRGEGDAAYKRAVIEADGALAQKLSTYEKVMGKFAEEFGKQKWVPEVQMGATGNGNVNTAQTMIDLLATKAAKDLSLDMNVNDRKNGSK